MDITHASLDKQNGVDEANKRFMQIQIESRKNEILLKEIFDVMAESLIDYKMKYEMELERTKSLTDKVAKLTNRLNGELKANIGNVTEKKSRESFKKDEVKSMCEQLVTSNLRQMKEKGLRKVPQWQRHSMDSKAMDDDCMVVEEKSIDKGTSKTFTEGFLNSLKARETNRLAMKLAQPQKTSKPLIRRTYECFDCHSPFLTLAQLVAHQAKRCGTQKRIEKKSEFVRVPSQKCRHCGIALGLFSDLVKHEEVCSNATSNSSNRWRYSCGVCDRKFTDANSLQEHKKGHEITASTEVKIEQPEIYIKAEPQPEKTEIQKPISGTQNTKRSCPFCEQKFDDYHVMKMHCFAAHIANN